MEDFFDIVFVGLIIVTTIAIIALIIYLWQYSLFVVLACAIAGAFIALYLVVSVLFEAHGMVQ